MISEFKKVFKKFYIDLRSGKLNNEVKIQDDSVKYVGLETLKNNLIEIEIWEKQKLTKFLKAFSKNDGDKKYYYARKKRYFKTKLRC